MDYCEDILGTQSFCVLPELALARSSTSKASDDFGFEVEGEAKVVTYLTGIADYVLWSFGEDKADIARTFFCACSYLNPVASCSTFHSERTVYG